MKRWSACSTACAISHCSVSPVSPGTSTIWCSGPCDRLRRQRPLDQSPIGMQLGPRRQPRARRRIGQRRAHRGVGKHHLAVGVHHRHRVLEAIDHRFERRRLVPRRELRSHRRELGAQLIERRAQLAELVARRQIELDVELAVAEARQPALQHVHRPQRPLREHEARAASRCPSAASDDARPPSAARPAPRPRSASSRCRCGSRRTARCPSPPRAAAASRSPRTSGPTRSPRSAARPIARSSDSSSGCGSSVCPSSTDELWTMTTLRGSTMAA